MSIIKHSDYKSNQHSVAGTLADTGVFDSELSQSLYSTTTDRFLSKTELARAVGKIGRSPYELPCDTSYVQEADIHNQANQLQVIAAAKLGVEDRMLSYKDALSKLARLGVDLRKVEQWGRLEAFNYLPPINIDKFSNYQDYFWCPPTPAQAPEYITIANAGLQTSDKIVHLYSRLADYSGSSAPLSPYEGMVWFNTTTLTLAQYAGGSWVSVSSLAYDTVDVNLANRTVTVISDITQRVQVGTVVYFEKTSTLPATFATVTEIVYDQATNRTTFGVDGVPDFGDLRDRVVFIDPLLQVVLAERANYTSPNDAGFRVRSRLPFAYGSLADIIWSKYTSVTTSDAASLSLGGVELTDTGTYFARFVDVGVRPGDVVHIPNGPNRGAFDIDTIVGDLILNLDLPNQTGAFFTETDVAYQILRPQSFVDIASRVPPERPLEGSYWVDTETDTLRQYTTVGIDPLTCPDLDQIWVPVVRNFSLLSDQLGTRYISNYYPTQNPWSTTNFWRHKSAVTALGLTGGKQAQLPIIEFNDGLELAEWRRVSHAWSYRASSSANFKTASTSPTRLELEPFTVYYPEGNAVLSIGGTYGDRTSEFLPGTQFRITESLNGQLDGIYTVKESLFVRYGTTEFRTRIVLDDATPLRAAFTSPGGKIVPVTTASGDPWAGYNVHWRYDGIDRQTMTSPRNLSVLRTIANNIIDTYSEPTAETKVALSFQEMMYTANTVVSSIVIDPRLHEKARYRDTSNATIVTINGVRRTDYVDVESTLSGGYVGGIAFTSPISVAPGDTIKIDIGPVVDDDIGRTSVPVYTGSDELQYVDLTEFKIIPQLKVERNQQPLFVVFDSALNPVDAASPLFEYVTDETNGVYNFWIQRKLSVSDSGEYEFASRVTADDGRLLAFRDRGIRFSEQVDSAARSVWFSDPTNPTFIAPEYVNRCGEPVCVLNDDGDLNPEGFWALPEYWTSNMMNETREIVTQSALSAHFRSIIDAQTDLPGLPEERATFFIASNPNLSAGGTIKMFNYGVGLLASSLLLTSTDPVAIIEFAHTTYEQQLLQLKELARDVLADTFAVTDAQDLPSYVSAVVEAAIGRFESNDEYSRLFGDSVNSRGVRNFIDTLPAFGLTPYTVPQILIDEELGIETLQHHDGHLTPLTFNAARIRAFFESLIKSRIRRAHKMPGTFDPNSPTAYPTDTLVWAEIAQIVPTTTPPTTVATSASPATATFEVYRVVDGQYVPYRPNTLTFVNLTRSNVPESLAVYSPATGAWSSVVTESIAIDVEKNLLLEVETRLYSVQSQTSRRYNVDVVVPDSNYAALMRSRFERFARLRNISDPYASQYSASDPFTWNYTGATIETYPQLVSPSARGSWQGLYENYYGTSIPHLEPWKLQGYVTKPEWWDIEYPAEPGRRWSSAMWFNIVYGIIPPGRVGPNGTTASTEFDNQLVAGYAYVPVNTESTTLTVNDPVVGPPQVYGPDDLLPPYVDMTENEPFFPSWVRSLFAKDPATGRPATPFPNKQLAYQYGTYGPAEVLWRQSGEYLYDELIVAWQIDPIRFTYLMQGFDSTTIGRLLIDAQRAIVQSHAVQQFHGDYVGDTTQTFVSTGINQWYVNYHRTIRQDVTNGEFRTLWQSWRPRLAYQFNRFVVPESIDLTSPTSDIVSGDYELSIKETEALDVLSHSGLRISVLSAPSKYSPLRAQGKGWNFEVASLSPVDGALSVREVENYDVSVDMSEPHKWYINRYRIADVTRFTTRTYQVIDYNSAWRSYSDLTSLSQTPPTTYSFTVSVTSSGIAPPSTYVVTVPSTDARISTIGGLIGIVNAQLVDTTGTRFATLAIRNGNLALYSYNRNVAGRVTIIDDNLFKHISPTNPSTGASESFVSIAELVTGDAYDSTVIHIDGNRTLVIEGGDRVVLQNSGADGTYVVTRVEYDLLTDSTLLFFEYDMPLTLIATGHLTRPSDGVGAWSIGDEVLFTSADTLPSPLSEVVPYNLCYAQNFATTPGVEYIVVSPARETALKAAEYIARGTAIESLGPAYITRAHNAGTGEFKVGRLVSTFQVGGDDTVIWRRHRLAQTTRTYNGPVRITSIQGLVDFVHGYEAAGKDRGFVFERNGDVLSDQQTGRQRGWQLELERFIADILGRTFTTIESGNEYEVAFVDESTLAFTGAQPVDWTTTTPIRLQRSEGNLPAIIRSASETLTRQTVFYTIPDRTRRGAFKLAFTASDAAVGNFITFDVPLYSSEIDPAPHTEVVGTPTTSVVVTHSKAETDLSRLIIEDAMVDSALQSVSRTSIIVTSGNQLTITYPVPVTGSVTVSYAPTTYPSFDAVLAQPPLADSDSQYAVTEFAVQHDLGVADITRLLLTYSTTTVADQQPMSPYQVSVVDANTILLKFDTPVEGGVRISIKPSVRKLAGSMTARALTFVPAYEGVINPYETAVWVQTPVGIVREISELPEYSSSIRTVIYDYDGQPIAPEFLLPTRYDTMFKVDVRRQSRRRIASLTLVTKGIEHVLTLNDTAVDGTTIYDQFLGNRNTVFYIEFEGQRAQTYRSNVGGYFTFERALTRNMEGMAEDLRYAYDPYRVSDSSIIAQAARDTIGYEGAVPYLRDNNVNRRSQFLFWKAMINYKGTTVPIDAFLRGVDVKDIVVDEFWAYKLAEFGSSGEQTYPELVLTVDDAVGQEFKAEFLLPQETIVDAQFTGIRLTDSSRWFRHPDLVDQYPYDTFLLNASVTHIDTSPEWLSVTEDSVYYVAPKPCDGIVMTRTLSSGDVETYHVGGDIDRLNAQLYRVRVPASDTEFYNQITVALIGYDVDSQDAAALIDTSSRVVLTRVPLWDPARGFWDQLGYQAVDIERDTDPAKYSLRQTLGEATTVVASDSAWYENRIGTIWFDTSRVRHVPYYDSAIFPDVNDRTRMWGSLEPWADVAVYEWTMSDVNPALWDAEKIRQTDPEFPKTGDAYRKLYRRVNGQWVAQTHRHEVHIPWVVLVNTVANDQAIPATVTAVNETLFTVEVMPGIAMIDDWTFTGYITSGSTSIAASLHSRNGRMWTFSTADASALTEASEVAIGVAVIATGGDSFGFDDSDNVDIYVNGTYEQSVPAPMIFNALFGVERDSTFMTSFVTLVRDVPVPTSAQLKAGEYRYVYPYSTRLIQNELTGEQRTVYYFWVRNKTTTSSSTTQVTVAEAESLLRQTRRPYMIWQDLRTEEEGFGAVWGNAFDQFEYGLPGRYRQMVVKGLAGRVMESDRYTLRFTRDFTLRDRR